MEEDEINPTADPFGIGFEASSRTADDIEAANEYRDLQVEFVSPEDIKPVNTDPNQAVLSQGKPQLNSWDYMADWSIGPLMEGSIHRAKLSDERMWKGQPDPVWNQAGYAPAFDEVLKLADKYELPEEFFHGLGQASSPDDLEARARQYSAAVLRDQNMALEGSGFDGFLKQTAAGMLDPAFLAASGGLHLVAKGWQANTAFSTFIKGATIEGGAAALVEGAKFTFDPTQSVEEAAFSVIGSAILGGGFEAAAYGVSTKLLERADKQLVRRAEEIAAARERREALRAQGLLPEEPLPVVPETAVPDETGSVIEGLSAAQNPNAPLVRETEPTPENPDAPKREGAHRWGTPVGFLARSPNDEVRKRAADLVWNPGSDKAQHATAGEATRRIYEAGTVYARQARMAALEWARAQGKASRTILNPFGQANTATLDEFMTTVAKVHAGVIKSSDPHVMKAVKAYQDGYEDALKYVQNSSYNGPGSEGLAGLSNEDFFDIEHDPKYVMRRFSSPGWNRTLARLGIDNIGSKLGAAVMRSNYDYFIERAIKELDAEDLANAPPATATAAATNTPAPETPPTARAFHGSPGPIVGDFDLNRAGEHRGVKAPAVWFTSRQDLAKSYGEVSGSSTPSVTEADLSAARLKEVDAGGGRLADVVSGGDTAALDDALEAYFALAKDEGFDGVLFRNLDDAPDDDLPSAVSDVTALFDTAKARRVAPEPRSVMDETDAFSAKRRDKTEPELPRAEGEFTAEEIFGGKKPKARTDVAKDFYNNVTRSHEDFEEFLAIAGDPEQLDPKDLKRGLRELYEIEGIDKGIPADPAGVIKRLRSLYKDLRKTAEIKRKAARFMGLRKADAADAPEAAPEPAPKAAEAPPAADAPQPVAAVDPDNRRKAIEDRAWRLAQRIGNKYARTVATLMNPAKKMMDMHAPITKEFREAAKDIIRKEFADGFDFGDDTEDAIEMLLDLVAPVREAAKDSNRAKRRLKLDLADDSAKDILDIFDWNAEALYTTYRRQLSGVGGFLKAGYTSVRQFDAFVERLRRDADLIPEEEVKLRHQKEADKLELLKGSILGTPPAWATPGSQDWIWLASMWRRYNFTSAMNNTGFLSLTEVMGSMVQMGPVRLLTSIPRYRKYIKDIRKGDPKAVESVMWLGDALMGHGSSQVRARLNGFADRGEDALSPVIDRKTSWLRDRVDTLSRKSANATSRLSGMAPITEWLRTSMVGAEAQAWVLKARKGEMPYNARRMKALGIDEPMWTRISAQLKQMTDIQSPDTGQARPFIDFTKWTDGEAANAFINSLDRNSRRLVMEGDAGHLPFFMSHPVWQLALQFLRYPLNAWTKQTMFAAKVLDHRALMEAVAMALGGGVGHLARVAAIATFAKDEGKERDEYVTKMTSGAEMGKAMAYYSAHGSMLPNVWDTGIWAADRFGAFESSDPAQNKSLKELKGALSFSNTRASSMPGDFISGNPSIQRVYRMFNSTGAAFKGPFTEDDLEGLVKSYAPLGNHIAMLGAVNLIGDLLPQEQD